MFLSLYFKNSKNWEAHWQKLCTASIRNDRTYILKGKKPVMVFPDDLSTRKVKTVDLWSLLVSQPNVHKTERACLISKKQTDNTWGTTPKAPETVHIHACVYLYTHTNSCMHACTPIIHKKTSGFKREMSSITFSKHFQRIMGHQDILRKYFCIKITKQIYT